MSNAKYSCIIPGCTETRAAHHYINHLLTHSNLELQAKLKDKLKRGCSGSLVELYPKVSGIEKRNQACLGCKKLFHKLPLQEAHKESCPNKEKHKDICRSILGETTPAVTIYSISDQSKQSKSIQCQTPPLATPKDDTLLDKRDFMYEMLEEVRETSVPNFVKKMIQLQESYPSAFDKIMDSYGSEADQVLDLMKEHAG